MKFHEKIMKNHELSSKNDKKDELQRGQVGAGRRGRGLLEPRSLAARLAGLLPEGRSPPSSSQIPGDPAGRVQAAGPEVDLKYTFFVAHSKQRMNWESVAK